MPDFIYYLKVREQAFPEKEISNEYFYSISLQ